MICSHSLLYSVAWACEKYTLHQCNSLSSKFHAFDFDCTWILYIHISLARYFIILYRYTFISRFDLRFSIIFDATAGATFTAAVTMFNAFQSVIGMMPIAHMAVGSIRQTNFQAIILYTMPHEMGLCRLYSFFLSFYSPCC